jgi:DNA gyrase subunit A
MAITVTNTGYIKAAPLFSPTARKRPRRQGAASGCARAEEDFVSHLFIASTHSYIMIFSDRGRAYLAQSHENPDVGSGRQGQGHRQPRRHGGGGKIAAAARGQGIPGTGRSAVRRDGQPKGRHQEDRPVGFPQSRAGGIIAMGVERRRSP